MLHYNTTYTESELQTPQPARAVKQHNETVWHFLLHCPTYEPQRQRLFYAIGLDARDLQRLLSTHKHLPALFDFIQASRRFLQTFGHIPGVELPDNKKH